MCNSSITCDSVRVIVPSLLCDIENFGDYCSGPTGQLAETQRTMLRDYWIEEEWKMAEKLEYW